MEKVLGEGKLPKKLFARNWIKCPDLYRKVMFADPAPNVVEDGAQSI